jgi:hypothetical protein
VLQLRIDIDRPLMLTGRSNGNPDPKFLGTKSIKKNFKCLSLKGAFKVPIFAGKVLSTSTYFSSQGCGSGSGI